MTPYRLNVLFPALMWTCIGLASTPCVLAATVDTAWSEALDAGEKAYKIGQLKMAEELFDTALNEAEKFPQADVRRATTLNDLAVVYDETDRYDKAEDCYNKALAIQEKALGADSAEVATTLNNMANLYKDQKKYEKAEPIYKRVIAIYDKTKGHESGFMAMAYHNLAVLYERQDRLKDAIPLYKDAIAIGDKALGPKDSHVIDLVGSLAQAYDHEGDTKAAAPLFHRYLLSVEEAIDVSAGDKTAAAKLKKFAAGLRADGQTGNADLVELALKYETK